MFRLFLLFLVMMVPASGLTGCASVFKKRKKLERIVAVAQPIFIGTITLVNAENGFVLIDNGRLPAPQTGAALTGFSSGAPSAELTATEVRKRPFIIADIRSGTPLKGDRVFMSQAAAPTPAAPAPAPQGGGEPDLPQLSPGPALDQ